MAWPRAIAVAEFLEKSPINKLASAWLTKLLSVADFAKEPLSVAGSNSTFSNVGSFPRRLSGKSKLMHEKGKFFFINSAMRTGAEKPWLFPPTTTTFPVFRSGRFQIRSEKSGFDCFCQ